MTRPKTEQIPARIYELPEFEWVPVAEDSVSVSERRRHVTDLIARLYVNSRKRGRPKIEEENDAYAA